MQKSKTAITPKAKSKGKDQTSENFSEDKEGTESAEREIFFDEVKRLTLLRLELHRCLMNILQYLSAYEDVGIDADNKCSGEMALYQMSIMEQEAQEAAGYIVQLPQTEFMLELHTAVQMIRQKLDITRRCAPDTIANAEDDESVIRYVRETGMRSSEKVGPVLNRLAAELMTRELSSEMQQATEYIYKQIALKEMNVGIEHEKDFKKTDSWEVPWDENNLNYIKSGEARVDYTNNKMTNSAMSKSLGKIPVHFMRKKGKGARVNIGEFLQWAKMKYPTTYDIGKFMEEHEAEYMADVEARKATERAKRNQQ